MVLPREVQAGTLTKSTFGQFKASAKETWCDRPSDPRPHSRRRRKHIGRTTSIVQILDRRHTEYFSKCDKMLYDKNSLLLPSGNALKFLTAGALRKNADMSMKQVPTTVPGPLILRFLRIFYVSTNCVGNVVLCRLPTLRGKSVRLGGQFATGELGWPNSNTPDLASP